MSEHLAVAREVRGVLNRTLYGYQAECWCGWIGPERSSRVAAEEDAGRHGDEAARDAELEASGMDFPRDYGRMR